MSIDTITIVELGPSDVGEFASLRLRGLREHPEAFGESAEEFERLSLDAVTERLRLLRDVGGFVLGARYCGAAARGSAGELVGVVGIRPNRGIKEAHRATLWGMYVAREHGGVGIGRRLIHAALDRCRREGRVEQVHLGVATTNIPALRLYRACGFAEYGIEPRVLRVNGRYYDELLMVHMLRPG